ncbi:DUF551 domain-containing protein [Thalassospira povalilytica]|uniref:DUF551 domain-containing protein n=1 Tax=Thalassospira povalilytica TaxID=732237 RepID=UPI003AA9A4F3
MEWQPREALPANVREFIAFNPVVGRYIAIQDHEGLLCSRWEGSTVGGHWYPEPTHWMPLPEPPK